MYEYVIYAAAALQEEDDTMADIWATRQYKAFLHQRQELIRERAELDLSFVYFCAGCASFGLMNGSEFALVSELPQSYRYWEVWRKELATKVQCNQCSLGLNALLILGEEISCSCQRHFEAESCYPKYVLATPTEV